jgi:hypothetical protein
MNTDAMPRAHLAELEPASVFPDKILFRGRRERREKRLQQDKREKQL